jgi:hypothetical protein
MLSLTLFPFTFILWTYPATPNESKSTVLNIKPRTLKSTPIVADASSSGNHCSSENRKRRLLFPTEELPMSKSLTLIVSDIIISLKDVIWVYIWVCGV